MILDQLILRLRPQEKECVDAPIVLTDENNRTSIESKPVNRKIFKRRQIVRKDSSMKSVVKAFSWRMIGTLDTIVVSYFVTHKLSLALSIGGIEVFTKVILYYLHERVWMKIHF